jgi:hypothetical protein
MENCVMTVISTIKSCFGGSSDNETAVSSRSLPAPTQSASDNPPLSANRINSSRYAHRDVSAFFKGIMSYIRPAAQTEEPAVNLTPVTALIQKWHGECSSNAVSGALSTGQIGFEDHELPVYHQHASDFLDGVGKNEDFQKLVNSDPKHVPGSIAFPGMDYAEFFSDKNFDTHGEVVFMPLPGDHGSSKLLAQTIRVGPEQEKVHIFLGASSGADSKTPNYSWSMQITSQEKFKATKYNG